MVCGFRRSKSRLNKATGAEPSGAIRDDKLEAVAAPSTFQSQISQITSVSDHVWKLSCRKDARYCGTKHMSKSQCAKHGTYKKLLEVDMSEKCTPLWREAHVQVKNVQSTPSPNHFWKLICWESARHPSAKHMSKSKCKKKTRQFLTTFGSWAVAKMQAIVAWSTFSSQSAQNTPGPNHLWKLICWKSTHHCNAKHMSQSNCTKYFLVGQGKLSCPKNARYCCRKHMSKSQCAKHGTYEKLLEVDMSEKCMPLWREAHVQVKNVQSTPGPNHFWKLICWDSARHPSAKHMSKSKCKKKTLQFLTMFGSGPVAKMHAIVARSTCPSHDAQNTALTKNCWKLICRKSARRCGAKHMSKSKCAKHTSPNHFWKLICWESARHCSAKHMSKSKCRKHVSFGLCLEVQLSQRCRPVWHAAPLQVKMRKTH